MNLDRTPTAWAMSGLVLTDRYRMDPTISMYSWRSSGLFFFVFRPYKGSRQAVQRYKQRRSIEQRRSRPGTEAKKRKDSKGQGEEHVATQHCTRKTNQQEEGKDVENKASQRTNQQEEGKDVENKASQAMTNTHARH